MLDRPSSEPSAAEREQRAAELIGRARELIPLLDRAGDRIEQTRSIPDDVLDALHDARMFRLLIPRSLDGEEVEPATLFEVIEAIAQGDASVGWCMGQGSGVSMGAAYLKPEIAETVFGGKRAVVATGPHNDAAKAVICDGGYRATGAWGFASGSPQAAFMYGHCRVHDRDGKRRVNASGAPLEYRTMIVPKASVAMADDWHVMGLKGTGSFSYSMTDLFVPDDFTFTRESDTDRREAGPLYGFSMYNMFGVGFAGVGLGLARRALDEFIKLAMVKKPYGVPTLLCDSGAIQSGVGQAEAKLQSSRTYVIETYRKLYAAVARGLRFTPEMRIANRLVTCHAIQQARDVIDFVHHSAGATAIFENSPFERRFRDMHTAIQQGQGQFSNYEQLGMTLMGKAPTRQT